MKLPPISSFTLKSNTLNSEKVKEYIPPPPHHHPLSPSLKIDNKFDINSDESFNSREDITTQRHKML